MKMLLKTDDGRVRVIADSAIGRPVQPWFIPDYGKNWRWRTAIAVRVGRLGKNLTRQYLGRYVDAMTKLWVPEADDCPASDFMDSAVVCGRWLETETLPENLMDEVIAASRFATLKTGDVIAVMTADEPMPIEPDAVVSVSLLNQEIMKINIK